MQLTSTRAVLPVMCSPNTGASSHVPHTKRSELTQESGWACANYHAHSANPPYSIMSAPPRAGANSLLSTADTLPIAVSAIFLTISCTMIYIWRRTLFDLGASRHKRRDDSYAVHSGDTGASQAVNERRAKISAPLCSTARGAQR